MNKYQFYYRLEILKRNWKKVLLPLTGFIALLWFLFRVIPKPSRAGYPCQQAAFPVASAFVIWLAGMSSSTLLFVKGKFKWMNSNYVIGLILIIIASVIFTSTALYNSSMQATVNIVKNNLIGPDLPVMINFLNNDTSTVSPESFVGVTKSSQSSVFDIEFEEIEDMVNEAVERAGGLSDLIDDGDTVVLKPNLISYKDFTYAEDTLSPEANGIATDYRVIQATVNLIRSINPSGKVYLIEGSGVGITTVNMSIVKWDQVTGLDGIFALENLNPNWFDTTDINLVGVSLPEEKFLYTIGENRYWLNKLYYEADVLISLPVLKNHLCTGTTGAIKNVGIGATPPKIYGLGPGYPYPYERWSKIEHGNAFSSRIYLHYWIHDFYMCRPVDFAIMDGLQGIENGPLCHDWLNGSDSIADDQMNMRLILASHDPIALDATAALLEGHDPELIPHLVTLHNDEMGCNDSRLLRINGIKVGDEKQNFEINDSGKISEYDDFDSPSFTVNNCSVEDDQLCFELTVDEYVSKIEVSIDGTYLNQIRIDDFEQFCFDLDTFNVIPGSEILVYAYDRYLNYSMQDASGFIVNVNELKTSDKIQLHPNPADDYSVLRLNNPHTGSVVVKIYDSLGNEIKSFRFMKSQQLFEKTIDLSCFKPGTYILKVSMPDFTSSSLLIIN